MGYRELLGVGLYTAAESARLLSVNPSTLRRWLAGYSYPLKDESVASQPPIVAGGQRRDRGIRVVTFLDLAELLVIKGFRAHRVALQQVRLAAQEASRLFDTPHPLVSHRVVTDGRHIFAHVQEGAGVAAMVSLTRKGQYVFVEAVEGYLADLDFDLETGMATRWWPRGRDGLVVVDPKVSFGAPHIAEVGVSTSALYELVQAGEDTVGVARWFDLGQAQVEAAVTFERGLQAA